MAAPAQETFEGLEVGMKRMVMVRGVYITEKMTENVTEKLTALTVELKSLGFGGGF